MKDVIDWALAPVTAGSLRKEDPSPTDKDKREERQWGNLNAMTSRETGNWTTLLGENFVKHLLESRGYNVWRPEKKESKCPDWETDDFVVEVKTSNWTISGTAGEKVLGVPYKYSAVPRLWGKPLIVVCVAYQEWELTHGNTQIFGKNITPEQKMMLAMWRKIMNIHFIPISKLINGGIKNITAYISNEHSKVGGREETTPENPGEPLPTTSQ